MTENQKKFIDLKNKIQDEALERNDTQAFQDISKLTSLMFDISSEFYTKGSNKAREIFLS